MAFDMRGPFYGMVLEGAAPRAHNPAHAPVVRLERAYAEDLGPIIDAMNLEYRARGAAPIGNGPDRADSWRSDRTVESREFN